MEKPLKEDLDHFAYRFVDLRRDALDAAAAREAADVGLGDAVDVVPESLPMSGLACCHRCGARR